MRSGVRNAAFEETLRGRSGITLRGGARFNAACAAYGVGLCASESIAQHQTRRV